MNWGCHQRVSNVGTSALPSQQQHHRDAKAVHHNLFPPPAPQTVPVNKRQPQPQHNPQIINNPAKGKEQAKTQPPPATHKLWEAAGLVSTFATAQKRRERRVEGEERRQAAKRTAHNKTKSGTLSEPKKVSHKSIPILSPHPSPSPSPHARSTHPSAQAPDTQQWPPPSTAQSINE